MHLFENSRTGDIVCMESVSVSGLRIQTVLDSGFYLYKKSRDPKAHCHLNYELYFVESGTCQTWCNGQIYSCEKGDIFVIPIGAEHNVQLLSQETSIYSLRFSFFHNEGEAPVYHQLQTLLEKPLKLCAQDQLIALAQQLRQELALQQFLCAEKFHGLLQIFYVEFLRCIFGKPSATAATQPFSILLDPQNPKGLTGYRKDTPQEYYIDIMDEFFTHLPLKNPTLTELANRLHLSISQTQRLIKNHYSLSFQQKLIQTKINYSKRLIATTSLSLEAVSEQIGYSSYNAFFEAFAAQTGQTPTEYRQSLQKQP